MRQLDQILQAALGQGLGYALFVFLLLYILKKQDERDKKADERESGYQRIITELTEKFGIINIINEKVDKIENQIEDIFKNKR